jgi:hypothetical protein
MTNERAIKIVAALTADNSKEDVVAKVFACEDILDDDVESWLLMPSSAHLSQFVEHNNSVANKFIQDRCEIFGYDEGVKIEMHNLRDRMESILISMIKYSAIFEAIAKEARSER